MILKNTRLENFGLDFLGKGKHWIQNWDILRSEKQSEW